MFLLLIDVLTNTHYLVGTILPPVAMALGGLGNLFCLLVFVLSHLRRLASSPMLIGLSVCHLVALWCIFLVWLERLDLFFIENPGWCQIMNFLHHSSSFLGVALVLGFTLERYISFCWMRNTSISFRSDGRQRRFLLLTICLSVVVPLSCTFLFAQLGYSKEFNCKCCFTKITYTNKFGSNTKSVPQYFLSVYYIIAAILMLVTLGLDISIMLTLFKRVRERRAANARMNSNGGDSRSLRKDFDEGSTDNVSIGHCDDIMGGYSTWPKSKIDSMPRPLRKMRKKQLGELRRSRSLLSIRSTINATRMLFAASLAFTLMQLPFVGNQVFMSFLFFMGEKYEANNLFYNFAAIFYVLSLDMAFIIYMCCGNNFREAVKMLLTCQYGRACAHAPCVKRKRAKSEHSNDRSARQSVDRSIGTPATEKKRPDSPEEDVSQYMDDTTELGTEPEVTVHEKPQHTLPKVQPAPVPFSAPQRQPIADQPNGTPKTYKEYNPRVYRPQGYGYSYGYGRPAYGKY